MHFNNSLPNLGKHDVWKSNLRIRRKKKNKILYFRGTLGTSSVEQWLGTTDLLQTQTEKEINKFRH